MMDAGYKFKPGNSIGKANIYYGDYIYADVNGDGVYGDSDDEEFQGRSKTPKYNFGFQASAAWNGFDISMVWAGAAGFDIYWVRQPVTTLPRQNGVTISHSALQTTTISMIRAIPMTHVQTSTVNIRV